jgi:hypothetical protein
LPLRIPWRNRFRPRISDRRRATKRGAAERHVACSVDARKESVMNTRLFTPFALVLVAAAWGCGGASEGAPSGEDLAAPAADNVATQQASPAEQATPAKPGDNVGKSQEPWLGVPGVGYGWGVAAPFYGVGYPYGGYGYGLGYGLGYGSSWGYSTTCVNGFCY